MAPYGRSVRTYPRTLSVPRGRKYLFGWDERAVAMERKINAVFGNSMTIRKVSATSKRFHKHARGCVVRAKRDVDLRESGCIGVYETLRSREKKYDYT